MLEICNRSSRSIKDSGTKHSSEQSLLMQVLDSKQGNEMLACPGRSGLWTHGYRVFFPSFPFGNDAPSQMYPT